MTRIIHIGDVHLQATNPRNADRLQAIDQIIADVRATRDVGLIAIPGDLFHAKSTIEDRNDLAPRLVALAAIAPLVWTRGNHDVPGDPEIFAKLKTVWPIYIVTAPTVLLVPTHRGETIAVAAVPYPDKAGLVAGGVAKDAVPETAAELLDVIFMQLAHELEVARDSGAIPIFLGHFNVRGSIASTGQPQIGVEQEIDRLSLERLPVVYCGLSHIHKAQEVGRGVYAGSIAAMDYGEVEPKSYVVVEAEEQADGSWAATWSRAPIATPPMFHVNGELSRDGFFLDQDAPLCPVCDGNGSDLDAMEYTSVPPPCPSCGGDGRRHVWDGCDVRVRFHYKASERALVDDTIVRELFAGALRLKIESVAEPDRELRAPEVAAARTLTEKLAAMRKEERLPARVAEKLALLETLDDLDLLARVGLQLRAIEQPESAQVAA